MSWIENKANHLSSLFFRCATIFMCSGFSIVLVYRDSELWEFHHRNAELKTKGRTRIPSSQLENQTLNKLPQQIPVPPSSLAFFSPKIEPFYHHYAIKVTEISYFAQPTRNTPIVVCLLSIFSCFESRFLPRKWKRKCLDEITKEFIWSLI